VVSGIILVALFAVSGIVWAVLVNDERVEMKSTILKMIDRRVSYYKELYELGRKEPHTARNEALIERYWHKIEELNDLRNEYVLWDIGFTKEVA
jgi:hypothetical protein